MVRKEGVVISIETSMESRAATEENNENSQKS
jgi:hypothetical protein